MTRLLAYLAGLALIGLGLYAAIGAIIYLSVARFTLAMAG